MPQIYRKVNQWSVHIQETGDPFYSPRSELTVDEAMVWFTGRSLETTTIPTKPTPTGFKIWILAQSGYCLWWLWHVHGKGPYGLVPQAWPAPASRAVNQFTWKDNALVLFLTTVFRDGEEVIRSRRRPAGDSAAKRAAREVFGPEVRKDLPVPKPINEYNHHMNGVDTSDQMRSYYQYGRPIRQGGWQSIAWNFLLEVVIVNSYLLQRWVKPS
ncbi:transposable element-derived protein [Colletotrichum tofieldiae]|uniref:Transposable element-derived protein n=1 Tax=Colletotrichum tofieldiae TaxID=708197 RepID=A0A166Q5Z2_9PEZI|nr:transposable element-derived protein [Colletotrichum tofieldiae]